MFYKKRKPPKYSFLYGKSPLVENRRKRVEGFHRPLKKTGLFFKKFKKIFLIFVFLTTTISSIYLVTFSNYFKIKNIQLIDSVLENITLSEEVKNSLKSSLGKSIVFIDLTELESKISSFFPELEEVKLIKVYPDNLKITFKQYPLAANIINHSNSLKKNYIINSIGYAVKEDLENPALPYIKIKSDEPVNTENQIIEAVKLKYLLDSTIYFQDKFGMKVKEIEYKPIAREVHLLTEKDFSVWLDIQKPYEDQLKKLKKALVKLDIYKENLAYIDLRIAGNNGDKIIYKRK